MITSNLFNQQPDIETERCLGYIPALSSYEDCRSMLENKIFIDCYGVAYSKEKILERLTSDIDQWKQYDFGPWMWYDKQDYAYIGRAGLKIFELEGKKEVEVSYAIRPEYWGRGIARELGKAVIDYAFHVLNLPELICFTHEKNHRSLRVMERLGFHFEKDFMYANLVHKLHRLKNTAYKYP